MKHPNAILRSDVAKQAVVNLTYFIDESPWKVLATGKTSTLSSTAFALQDRIMDIHLKNCSSRKATPQHMTWTIFSGMIQSNMQISRTTSQSATAHKNLAESLYNYGIKDQDSTLLVL
jgi:hypothetical protein